MQRNERIRNEGCCAVGGRDVGCGVRMGSYTPPWATRAAQQPVLTPHNVTPSHELPLHVVTRTPVRLAIEVLASLTHAPP